MFMTTMDQIMILLLTEKFKTSLNDVFMLVILSL